jgi:signal transduction histidine kinase/HPt (histidine-containing phosphotransfer) domain-containing protein/ActR/RegA family two-component response regulator
MLIARVGATGAGFAECDEDGRHVTVRPEHVAGLPALAGHYHAPDFGSQPFARLADGHRVVHEDIAASGLLEAAAKARYEALGIAAIAMIPEREHGRLARILFVVADSPQRWPEDDLRLFEGFTVRLSADARRVRAESLAAERRRLLEESRDRMARAEEAARAATWTLDLRHGTISWPTGTRRLFDLPDYTLLRTLDGWRTLVHPEDQPVLQQQIRDATARRGNLDARFRLRLPDGQQRWLQMRAEVITDSAGEPVQLTGLGIDVTDEETLRERNRELWRAVEERASSEERLRQASDSKSAFLANMSHEIRTPLGVILGLAERLRREVLDPRHSRRLDQLRDTSEHLLQVINDILDLSKIEAGQLELADAPFSLGDVLARTHQLFEDEAARKGLRLELDVPVALQGLALRGDALRLRQVLINLCSNAIKFTAAGRVRIAADALPSPAGKGRIRLSVTDTGVGIEPALREQLFEPFVQGDASAARRVGGTGLGLAICRRIVDRMGGSIEVDSAPGTGSRFTVELALPLAAPGPPGVDMPHGNMPAAPPGVAPRVLLVEDHPLSQEILTEMLEELQCDVTLAGTGIEAVDLAGANEFDLILMDLQLPGMDGLAATRLIRLLRTHRRTPIVALSANVFREDRERALDAGMNEHVGKPVTPAGLAAVLARWVPATSPAVDGDVPPDMQAGDRAAAAALLARVLDSVADDCACIRQELAAGRPTQAAASAHRAAGAAALAGARALGEALARLERSLGEAGSADSAELLATVEREMHALTATAPRATSNA